MILLDCETLASAELSMGNIFDVSRDELYRLLTLANGVFEDPDWRRNAEPSEIVAEKFMTTLGRRPVFDGVCWFHFTRVPPTMDFSGGILPPIDRLDDIWELLFSMLPQGFKRSDWARFRESMTTRSAHYAHLYRMKTATRGLAGPYGMLLKEIAFQPGRADLHYFQTPEIIEDISICFREDHGFDLQGEYVKRTMPCIVKFICKEPEEGALKDALYYLYLSRERGGAKGIQAVCFDAGGKPIPNSDILKVEFPPPSGLGT